MEALLQLFKNLGFTKIVTILGSFIVISGLFIFIAIKYSTPQLITLYSNLEVEDSNKIVTELEQKNIPFSLRANGSQILVPEDQILRTRMAMAQEGLPGKGSIVGYEIFDNSDTSNSSNFVQNINLLRALEGELGRTISSFKNIKKARVHLVIPKRELFSRDNQKPSGSVLLDMKGSNEPSREEVKAIAHLVASSVAGLDAKQITIVDTKGKPYKVNETSDGSFGELANTAQEYKAALEMRLKKTIEEILEKTIGPGGVDAQVSAETNFDRIVTNSETYDPDGQVVRSTQTIEEKDSAKENVSNTDASVANNVPNAPTAASPNQNTNTSQKSDETVNYEISKTVKNQISETGTIKKLSIAVLVDGIYSKNPRTGETTYTPRSAEELKQIEKLVKSAVGFSEERKDKIEVENMQFKNLEQVEAPETFLDWLKGQLENQLYGIVKTTLLITMLFLILVVFVRPFIFKIFDAAHESLRAQVDAEVAIAQAEVESANIKAQMERESRLVEIVNQGDAMKLKRNNAFRSINDIVDQCPQETLIILRNWLNS